MFGIKKIRYRAEYEKALAEARREIDARSGGGTTISAAEVFDLYRYARERTNLSKHEDELTDSQLAWKKYSNVFHNMLTEILAPAEKASLENMSNLYHAKDIMYDVVESQRAVETLFIQQELIFLTYEEKNDPENLYQSRLKKGEKAMLACTEPSAALEAAHELLKMVEVTKDGLVGAIKQLQQRLRERLDELGRAVKKYDDLTNTVQDLSKTPQDDNSSETEQWLALTEELFQASIARTDALVKEFELDALFPSIIVAKNGVNPNELSDNDRKKFTETVVETSALKMSFFQKIQEIRKQRDPLTVEFIGGQKVYDNLVAEAAKTASDWLKNQ